MLLDTLDGCRLEVPVVGVLCASDDDVELLAGLAGPGVPVVVQEGTGLERCARGPGCVTVSPGEASRCSSRRTSPGCRPERCIVPSRFSDEGVDVVLGPGHDGGYWLIGMRRAASGALRRDPVVDCGGARGDPSTRCRDLSPRGPAARALARRRHARATWRPSPPRRRPCRGGGRRRRSAALPRQAPQHLYARSESTPPRPRRYVHDERDPVRFRRRARRPAGGDRHAVRRRPTATAASPPRASMLSVRPVSSGSASPSASAGPADRPLPLPGRSSRSPGRAARPG